jgi:hypothetical protein
VLRTPRSVLQPLPRARSGMCLAPSVFIQQDVFTRQSSSSGTWRAPGRQHGGHDRLTLRAEVIDLHVDHVAVRQVEIATGQHHP